MRSYGIIVVIQIIEVYSTSKISVLNGDEPLAVAAVDIADKCFASFERWSEFLIVPSHASHAMFDKIQHESKTSNLIVFPESQIDDKQIDSGKCNDYFNSDGRCQKTKPIAVLITTHSLKHLESVLSFLKNHGQIIWRPGSYFLIVLETRGCELETCNDMFQVIWHYWILNAVIVCSLNDPVHRNKSEIELHTFNPYSGDHSPQWETIFFETVQVLKSPGNFNHSWYIFKHKYTGIESFEDCGDLFFDKTLNLDGYVIPISTLQPELLSEPNKFRSILSFVTDVIMLKALARKLRFNFAQVTHEVSADDYGRLLPNGSYTSILRELHNERSHFVPTTRRMSFYPGLGMTYSHGRFGACFASRIIGNRPQWINLVDAKFMWIVLGLGLLFSTVVLYLQNRSRGILSALFDAERLIIGNSIIHTPTLVKHRIILGSIFLVVLVIDGVMRGRFISILTAARPYPNLDTLEQLRNQEVDVYGHHLNKALIPDDQINARLNSSLTFPECMAGLGHDGHQQACLYTCQILQYLSLNSTYIHVSPPFAMTHVSFMTAMHWPMKNRYSFEVQKLVESGILEKWQSNIHREIEVDSWKQKRAAKPPYVRPTKLNDLLPAFMLLFVGLSAALIVFAWEMLAANKNPR